MRLFLLPVSTRQTLIYCDRMLEAAPLGSTTTPSIFSRLAAKASNTATIGWAEWEAKPKGWQKEVTVYGNQLLRQIPHQEWALKGIPPLTSAGLKDAKVECLYPASVLAESQVHGLIRQLAIERQPFHRKRMWQSAAVAPFMLPFAIIPMVPNLPLGYALFRTWSHYRALQGGKHLEALSNNKVIAATPSKAIDAIYATSEPSRSPSRCGPSLVAPQSGSVEEERLLLQPQSAKAIAAAFALPNLQVEIERAIKQVEQVLGAKKIAVDDRKECSSCLT